MPGGPQLSRLNFDLGGMPLLQGYSIFLAGALLKCHAIEITCVMQHFNWSPVGCHSRLGIAMGCIPYGHWLIVQQ